MVLRLGRTKSMDGMGSSHRSLDSSYSAGKFQACTTNSTSRSGHTKRRPPKRTRSGFGNAARSILSASRNHQYHHNDHHHSNEKKNRELNIFCSDVIVSTEFTLSRMEHARKTPTITKLEFEDLIERRDQTLFLEVRDILIADQRPWKYVRFVDHLYSEERYDRYLRLKGELWRLIQDDVNKGAIPIQFQAIMEIPRGSQNAHVASFLQRIYDCNDLQSLEFAGALFGYRPSRIPFELGNLCKHGYLRESFVLRVSYSVPDLFSANSEAETTTTTACDSGGDDPMEWGDNSISIEKARSVQVLGTCIERILETAVDKEKGINESQASALEDRSSAWPRRTGSDSSTNDGLSKSLSSLSLGHPRTMKSKCSSTRSESSKPGSTGSSGVQSMKLRRTCTTGDLPPPRRSSLEYLSDGSNASQPTHAAKPATNGYTSSLQKVSTRKGCSRRAIMEDGQQNNEQSNDRGNQNSERTPRSLRLRRSRSVDGSMTSALQRRSTATDSDTAEVATSKREPPLRRHKTFDTSRQSTVRASRGVSPQRIRRPVRRLAVVLSTEVGQFAVPIKGKSEGANIAVGAAKGHGTGELSVDSSEHPAIGVVRDVGGAGDIASQRAINDHVVSIKPPLLNDNSLRLEPKAEPQCDILVDQEPEKQPNEAVDAVEGTMHVSMSFIEVFGVDQISDRHNNNSKSIMELYGSNPDNQLREEPGAHSVDSSSTLTMAGSCSNSSYDILARGEAILPPRNKTKKEGAEKAAAKFHKSISGLEISPGTKSPIPSLKKKLRKQRKAAEESRMSLNGPLARLCKSMSTLEYRRSTCLNSDGEGSFPALDHPYKDQEPDFHWETNTLVSRNF